MTILDDVKEILGKYLHTPAICGIAVCNQTICNVISVMNTDKIYLSRLPELTSDCMAITLDGGSISKETTRLKTNIITFMSRGRLLDVQRQNIEETTYAFLSSFPQVVNGITYMSVLSVATGHFDHKDRVGPLYTESVSFEVLHT